MVGANFCLIEEKYGESEFMISYDFRLIARSPMNGSVRSVNLRPDFRVSIEFYISLG